VSTLQENRYKIVIFNENYSFLNGTEKIKGQNLGFPGKLLLPWFYWSAAGYARAGTACWRTRNSM